MVPVNPLARLRDWLRPGPRSTQDLAAEQEAARLREEMLTTRASSKAPGGEAYEAKDRPRRM